MSGQKGKSQPATELVGAGYPKPKSKFKSIAVKTALVAFVFLVSAAFSARGAFRQPHQVKANLDICSQANELIPAKNKALWETLSGIYGTDDFKMRAVKWLGGAIKVETVSYDNMDVKNSTIMKPFSDFHDYLFLNFPKVHTTLELTKVNTYGLLYEWKGSDTSLQPILLTAHQDVVPVEQTTCDQWGHDPFSGDFSDGLIWGRGSSDDKNGLIGIMSTIESLLEQDFKPSRSVVLAFGFDEEASGIHGARTLAVEMLKIYGNKSFAMLVDEGVGYGEEYGQVFALPGIGEKGYLDVQIDVASPGGHSSLPPPHTSIGMLAQLLVEFEKNPIETHLSRDSPVYKTVQCLAAYAPNLPPSLKQDILESEHSDEALCAAEKTLFKDRTVKSLVGTTQAIDLIQGGVKVNALPEQAWAVINHRISTESSVDEVKKRDTDLLRSLAIDFNLTYSAFGVSLSEANAPAYGSLNLSDPWGTGFGPAPISPIEGDAAPYNLLSGSIKAAYNSHRNMTGNDNIVVSPGVPAGNTDTRHYWDLSNHIFRYGHLMSVENSSSGIHTVNETISADNFVETIGFFTVLILNADESRLI